MASPTALIVLSTVPDRKFARRIAETVVKEGLAACVNRVGPVLSTYRWKGKLCRDAEYLLVMKTTRRRFPALAARLRALHPYDVPEIVATPVAAGAPAYLRWLGAAVR